MLTVITGSPGTGKSRLARRSAQAAAAQGFPVLVVDPYVGKWPGAEPENVYPPEGLEDFLAVALAKDAQRRPTTFRCLVILDEGGWQEDPMALRRAEAQLAGQRRHHAHSVIIIAHRYMQIEPTARITADRVYLFQQLVGSCKEAAKDWGKPEALEAADLDDGVAMVITKKPRAIERRVLWTP